MSFKLLTISSIYPGYIELFHSKNPNFRELSYQAYYKSIFEDSTEFAASYSKTYNKLGIDAKCIIANNPILQDKWCVENNLRTKDRKSILLEQVKKHQPEVLFIEDLKLIDKEWIKTVRNEIKSIKKIVAYHCAPYDSNKLEIIKQIDFLITCTPGLKSDFEKFGIKTYSVYHGFDSELLPKINEMNLFQENKIVFTGSLFTGDGYHKDRIELIESILKEKIDISLYLNLQQLWKIRAKQSIHFIHSFLKKINLDSLNKAIPLLENGLSTVKNYSKLLYKANKPAIYGIEMYKLLANSNIILNNHGQVAGKYAGNMRLFEATGVGSCLLTDNKTNMPELFETNQEVVVYEGIEDCIQKMKWLLENEEERKKIAIAGQQRTLKHHRVEDRCKQMIEIIEKEIEATKEKPQISKSYNKIS